MSISIVFHVFNRVVFDIFSTSSPHTLFAIPETTLAEAAPGPAKCPTITSNLLTKPAFTVHILPNAPHSLITGVTSAQSNLSSATTAQGGDGTVFSTLTVQTDRSCRLLQLSKALWPRQF